MGDVHRSKWALPTEIVLNSAMNGQVFGYWLNLWSPYKEIVKAQRKHADKAQIKNATPNLFADMLKLSGWLTDDDCNMLYDLVITKMGLTWKSTARSNQAGSEYTSHRVKLPVQSIRRLLGSPANVVGTARGYNSPIVKMYEVGHNQDPTDVPGKAYKVDQHVYLELDRVMVKEAGTRLKWLRWRATVNFNPNRFVSDPHFRHAEPVYEFIRGYLLPRMSGTWISRLDVNCDLLVSPNAVKLRENDGKKDAERLTSTYEQFTAKDHNGVTLVKYNKTAERTKNSTNHSYLHAEELDELKRVTGEDVTRLEIRLTEYGLKKVIRSHREQGTLWLIPKWLDIVYAYREDDKRKQASIKKELKNAYSNDLYALMASLPFVTPRVIQATLDYHTQAAQY